MKMSNSAIKELRKKVSLCLSNVREENNLFDILCLVQVRNVLCFFVIA